MKRIHGLYSIPKRGAMFAALFAVTLALTGLAHADAMPSSHSHKGKKGSLKITATTEVGGVALHPGDYEVREINSSSGPAVEFVHLFRNEQASELMQAEEEEVVAQVKFTEQALSSPPKHTQLLMGSDTTKAIALEIRGNGVDYLFAPPESNANAELTVDTNGGSHE